MLLSFWRTMVARWICWTAHRRRPAWLLLVPFCCCAGKDGAGHGVGEEIWPWPTGLGHGKEGGWRCAAMVEVVGCCTNEERGERGAAVAVEGFGRD